MPFFDLSGTDLNFLLMEDFDEIPSVSQLLDTQLLQEIDKNPQELTTVEPLPSKETAEIETKTEEPNTARFVKPLSADEIKARNYKAVPKKTRKSNNWALGVWREWSKYRNSQHATIFESGYPIPENVGLLNNELLDYWGQRFILEVRRKDGKVYPPNTLIQITRTECSRSDVSLMKSDCVEFVGFRTALDTRMKNVFKK